MPDAFRGFIMHPDESSRFTEEEVSFKEIVDLLPMPVAVVDSEGRIEYRNSRFVDLIGYTSDEMATTEEWLKLAYPIEKYRKEVVAAWKSGRESGQGVESSSSTFSVTCKDGKVRSIRFRTVPFGEGRRFVVCEDMTELRRAEEDRLRRLDRVARFQDVVFKLIVNEAVTSGRLESAVKVITEAAADALEVERAGIWLLDEKHEQLVSHDVFVRGKREHVQDNPLAARDYPGYFEALEGGRAIDAHDAMTDPRTREFKGGYLIPNGITSMLDAVIMLSGELVGVVCHEHCGEKRTWTDDEITFAGEIADRVAQALLISKRKAAEKGLARAEALLLASAEQTPAGILIAEVPDEGYRLANSAALRINGIEEPPGASVPHLMRAEDWNIFHPDGTPYSREELPLSRAIREGVTSSNIDVVIRRTDGEERRLLANAAPVFDSEGKIVAGVVVFSDVTEIKQAEEERRKLEIQMQHAQKLESLGVLAGGIAHDFNNLLVGVLGNADLALMKQPEASPSRRSVEEIKKAAVRASELTNQLLAYSGKGHMQIQPVALNQLVEEMAHLLEVSISKKIRRHFDFVEGLPAIEADPVQMSQVVMNFITNAAEAIGEKEGVIHVSTGIQGVDRAFLAETYMSEDLPQGRYVWLEVADTGCGMDEETREKIFDPFFTTKFTGRGLGLASVLGIVRSHKGAIEVRTKEGEGTSVKVLFKCSEVAAAEAALSKGASPLQDGWKGEGTILIVDDEESVRQVASMMLQATGFSIKTASDGFEGIEIFRRHKDEISLVLLDVTMPRIDGDEAFLAMLRIREDAKVVLWSGYDEKDAVSRCMDGKMAGYVQKPFDYLTLIGTVRQALEG